MEPDRRNGHSQYEFVSLREVAARLSVSRSTAKRWLLDQGVPVYRLGPARNSTVRFRRDLVERAIENACNAFPGFPDAGRDLGTEARDQ